MTRQEILKKFLITDPNWKKIKKFAAQRKLKIKLYTKNPPAYKDYHGFYSWFTNTIYIFIQKNDTLGDVYSVIVHELAHAVGFQRNFRKRVIKGLEDERSIELADLNNWEYVLRRLNLELDVVAVLINWLDDYVRHHGIDISTTRWLRFRKAVYGQIQKELLRQLLGKKVSRITTLYQTSRKRDQKNKKRKSLDSKTRKKYNRK